MSVVPSVILPRGDDTLSRANNVPAAYRITILASLADAYDIVSADRAQCKLVRGRLRAELCFEGVQPVIKFPNNGDGQVIGVLAIYPDDCEIESACFPLQDPTEVRAVG